MAWLALLLAAPLLVVAAWLGPKLVTLRRQWRFLKHLPGPPPHHWLTGHAADFSAPDSPLRLAAYTARYGSVYRLRVMWNFLVIATDPPLVRAVLQNPKTYVPKARMLYRPIEIASGGLPNVLTSSDGGAEGEHWRLVRGAWMKCFTSPNLKRVLPIVHRLCERVIEQLTHEALAAPPPPAANGQPVAPGSAAAAASTPRSSVVVDVCSVCDRITLDVIGQVCYGRDFGAVEHKRSRYLEVVAGMLQLMHDHMTHALRRALLSRSGGPKGRLRAEWAAANAAEVMRAVAEPPGEHTIAGQLLALRNPRTGAPLSLEQLQAETALATLAGFETTSNGLSWTLAALAAHPQALTALEEELAAAGLLAAAGRPRAQLEWQALGKLPYLNAVIRESLRLFSPAANGSFRLCSSSDITLADGLTLPRGTAIGVPLFAFGHNPSVYGPDAEAFRPERWLAPGPSSSAGPGDGAASGSGSGSTAAPAGERAAAGAPAAAAEARPAGAARPRQLQDPWTFSIGQRDCAGQALARMELQVVVSALVGAFHIRLGPEVATWQGLLQRRVYHTTLQADGGIQLQLTPRRAGSA